MIPMTNIGRQNSPITPWLRYLADYFKLIHIPVFFNTLKSGFDRSKYRYLKTQPKVLQHLYGLPQALI